MAKSQAAARAKSRYHRVCAILASAAGDSPSDYDGLGRFWELPLAVLLEARVFGVRLIAPEVQNGCCGSASSRSANSGLILALRGAPPFDGVRFPPFMWGGKRVAITDIEFIADWIDDGCPADERGVVPLDLTVRELIRADVKEFEFAIANRARGGSYREGEPRQRANIDCLNEAEVDAFRDAFRRTFDLNDSEEDRRNYNNQALIHQNHCQHGWERFLPWHRAYLYEFEQGLQDFVADTTIPYWDWIMPHYRPYRPQDGLRIPRAFQAFLREPELEAMLAALRPKPTPAQIAAFRDLLEPRRYFTSQHEFFCHVVGRIGYTEVTPDPADSNRRAMIYALLRSNALWYPLRYPGEFADNSTINQSIFHYHYPKPEDVDQILNLNNFRDFGGGNVYNASFGFLDQNPHNTLHIWTGGQNPDVDGDSVRPAYVCDPTTQSTRSGRTIEPPPPITGELRNLAVTVRDRKFHSKADLFSQPPMGDMLSNLTASYDPVFWPVHSNVDRLWWLWQKQNPSGTPDDLDSVLSPWSYTTRDVLDISRFGYEYVRCSFFMPVGLEAVIGRFVSTPIRVDAGARGFKRAEVRMHWVPQLPRSCFIRAFLNDPGADAATPLQGNPHYGGYLAIFGHGECYGGPGHCDLPPVRSRQFDQRPRSHNMPRNHRLEVTDVARRMLEKDGTLQITLLVIGADYREERDLLRLEGVSLNLLD